MRYLKPRKPKIEISGNIYELLFSLDVIDNIQDKSNMPMTEIIMTLFENENRKLTIQVLIKYLTGQLIEIDDNELDYYSNLLINTYINQMKCKEIPELKKSEPQDENYEFIDIERMIYIGTAVLNYPDDRVWNMTIGEYRTLHNEHAKYNGWFKEEKEQSMLGI